MIRSVRRKVVAAALAVGAGTGLAATLPASPAVAFFSPPLFLDVVVQGPGHLVANGAAVEVPAEVTCNPGVTADLRVSVTQAVNGKIAQGYGFATVGCTGSHQRVLVTVVASQNRAFKAAKAFAQGDVFACVPGVCGSEHSEKTITLKK